jgi:hypothetical protein
MKKLIVPMLALSLLTFHVSSEAAFGGARASSSSGMGVSRSVSRPSSSSTYSRPSGTSSNSSYTGNSSYSSGSTSRQVNSYPSSNTPQNTYQQPSAMRQIATTAAGVGGGILAAQAISSLISSPSHQGVYTSPQNPGQYYNAQGIPQQVAPQSVQQENYQQPTYAPQQQRMVFPEHKSSFSFWGMLGGLIQFIVFMGVLAVIAYGAYKLFFLAKRQIKMEKANMQYSLEDEFADIDQKAMDIFFNFQKNADNKAWVGNNTKYMNVDSTLSDPCTVEQYQHNVLDCSIEQGKLRASVEYTATVVGVVNKVEEKISQIWHFEKQNDKWYLIGAQG